MPGLLGKKFPAQVARPMWPFYAGGLVILYGVNSFATILINTDEYKNDPRNPAARSTAPPSGH